MIAVSLLGAGGAVLGLVLSGDDDYPDQWTAEIQPFVEIVEDERDLEFEHPVYVEFLPAAEFEEQVTADEADLTDEDREEIEQTSAMLRAVGLIESDVDLFDATNSLLGAGTLAYYSTKDERIRIRGEQLTPAIEATLVHELTHALQDQHFDIGDRAKELDEADDDGGAGAAFQAVVEGDANRIESAYVQDLDEEDLDAVMEEQQRQAEDFQERAADLPPVLSTLLGAPYTLGEAMLQLAAEDDGNESVDELFESPPTTEEHLVDPWTLLLGDPNDAVDVDVPPLEQGAEELDSGTFGAMGWLLVLAERIPVLQALDATDGWGGDAYVSFERGGQSCVAISYQGDTTDDVNELDAALHRWIAVSPDSPAAVAHQEDGGLLFTSCDPGAPVGSGSSQEALDVALTRTYVAIGFLDSGANDNQARCLADSLVHNFSVQQLTDPDLVIDAEMQAELQELSAACE